MKKSAWDKKAYLQLFYIISALPAIVLLAMAVLIASDCYRIGRLDEDRMYRITKRNLEDKTEKNRMVYRQPFEDPEIDDRTVYVFGASSLVISDGEVFPSYLEKELIGMGYKVKVVNKGTSGLDSFYIKRNVSDVLQKAKTKPALFVFYTGHNDYNNAYSFDYNNINGPSANLLDELGGVRFLLRIAYRITGQSHRRLYSKDNENYNYIVYSRLKAPEIINALQAARIASLDSDAYNGVNSLIREYYKRNMGEDIRQARRLGIPVVICTLIGNLQKEPFGDYDEVTTVYRRGMSAAYYEEKIGLLTMAKDNEIMTFDIRAKSQLNDDIREMGQPGVFILDVENEFKEQRFQFGNDDFLDYFHMEDKTHRKLGKLLAEFIKRNNLIVSSEEKRNDTIVKAVEK